MKRKFTLQTPRRFGGVKSCSFSFGKVLSAVVTLSLLTFSASAQTNLFNAAENDPVPDTYPGIDGDGWAGPWDFQFGVNGGNSGYWGIDPHVINANPLQVGTNAPGGNYLNFGLANSQSAIRRKYISNDNLNTALSHIIEFDIRMDAFLGTFTSASDGISICTRRTLGDDVGGNATFWIRAQAASESSPPYAQAGVWNFYNGGTNGTSDANGTFSNSPAVPFVIGRAYHFTIKLDPTTKTYIGTVTDGTNSYTTSTLRYKSWVESNFNNTSNSTILAFVPRTSSRVAVGSTTETNVISVDNIRIYADKNAIAPLVTLVNPISSTIHHPIASNMTFTAETLGPDNTLPAATLRLILNGVDVSAGLVASGTDGDKLRTVVYSGLVPNTIYNGSFSANDQNGRGTTNTFFFDTFVENEVTVLEAENYNFETGEASCLNIPRTNFNANGYLQNPLPSMFDLVNGVYTNEVEGYVDRMGVAGVDYFDVTPVVVQSQFRFCDTLDTRTKPGAEYLRPAYVNSDISDFVWEHVDAGDWANYTHQYANTNYQVYLRVGAGGRTVNYDLARVTSDRTQPNQTTVSLGTITVPPLAARETLTYRPLVDAFGNPIQIHLNGLETLRLTALDAPPTDNTYVNFILLNPVPGNTTPPFVAKYFPLAGDSNLPPQTAVALTLGNGSSPVAIGTISLNINGSNVTSLANIAATAGGATINYLPPAFFLRNSYNTVQVIYGDGSGSSQTNTWSFHVGTYLPGETIKINFTQPASTNFPGYLKDTSFRFGNRGNGFSYGWDRDFSEDARQNFGPAVPTAPDDVPAPDQRYATFTHLNKASPARVFELNLPNGNYGVFAVAGDATAIDSYYVVAVEGVIIVDGQPTFPDNQWISGSNVVTVADGRLTLTSGPGVNNGKINFIDIWPLDYPPVDLSIRNAAVTGGTTFSFNISTIQRAQHLIEYKNQMSDPWQPLTNIIGTGASMTVTDPLIGSRLYRMRIQ